MTREEIRHELKKVLETLYAADQTKERSGFWKGAEAMLHIMEEALHGERQVFQQIETMMRSELERQNEVINQLTSKKEIPQTEYLRLLK